MFKFYFNKQFVITPTCFDLSWSSSGNLLCEFFINARTGITLSLLECGIIVIIIIIIIIFFVITFMYGIYDYLPETNHVSRVYNVAVPMYLQFVLHVMLFRPVKYVLYFCISTFRSTCAVPNMAVFCSSLISCFPGMLLRYSLSHFEMVPVAHIITGITFACIFHMHWIYIMSSLYFKLFSAFFLITLLSPRIATFINMHVPFLLSRIMMSGLLWGIVLSVGTCWFHNMVP